MRTDKKRKLVEEVMGRQYALVGLTFDQVKAMSNEEFFKHRITKEQSDEWEKWAVDYMAKKMRWSKAMSKRELGWLDFQVGLSIEINQNQ